MDGTLSLSCAGEASESNSADAAPAAGPNADGSLPRRQVYGRRTGPRLRPSRRRLLGDELPRLRINLHDESTNEPERLFPRPVRAVWLEIGFGGGEHLEAQALRHADVGIIGVEPFISGVARLLAGCAEHRLDNVRIMVDDARLLLKRLPDASIERAFVLFPDPWPKRRHWKRRIVNADTLADLARVLAPGGELRLATDDRDYARWMLAALLNEARLTWTAERAQDWREPPDDWVPTRYEAKALAAGRRPVHLVARRD